MKSATDFAPDTMIDLGDGHVTCLMFLYAPEGASLRNIATEQGFELMFVGLETEDDDLMNRYMDGDEGVMREWSPAVPEGFSLASKHDTEDGPIAVFIRPKVEATPPLALILDGG